jgi:stage IV sporulation protein FB
MSIRRTWFRLIRLFGIRWTIHPLLAFVMLASAVTGTIRELAVLFTIVIVHELGHVMAMRAFGWRVREIRLLPFGGAAETEEAGTVPAAEEAVVAIAGPLQNVWMGTAALLLARLDGAASDWAMYIAQANAIIALFNLLPIQPLDGGRLLSAWLSVRLPYQTALKWSMRIGLALSVAMIIAACVPVFGGVQLNLLLIGLFLFATNWRLRRDLPYLFVRFLVRREAISANARRKGALALPIVVQPACRVGDVLRLFRRGRYHLIYVLGEGGRIEGIVPEESVIATWFRSGGQNRAVSELFG